MLPLIGCAIVTIVLINGVLKASEARFREAHAKLELLTEGLNKIEHNFHQRYASGNSNDEDSDDSDEDCSIGSDRGFGSLILNLFVLCLFFAMAYWIWMNRRQIRRTLKDTFKKWRWERRDGVPYIKWASAGSPATTAVTHASAHEKSTSGTTKAAKMLKRSKFSSVDASEKPEVGRKVVSVKGQNEKKSKDDAFHQTAQSKDRRPESEDSTKSLYFEAMKGIKDKNLDIEKEKKHTNPEGKRTRILEETVPVSSASTEAKEEIITSREEVITETRTEAYTTSIETHNKEITGEMANNNEERQSSGQRNSSDSSLRQRKASKAAKEEEEVDLAIKSREDKTEKVMNNASSSLEPCHRPASPVNEDKDTNSSQASKNSGKSSEGVPKGTIDISKKPATEPRHKESTCSGTNYSVKNEAIASTVTSQVSVEEQSEKAERITICTDISSKISSSSETRSSNEKHIHVSSEVKQNSDERKGNAPELLKEMMLERKQSTIVPLEDAINCHSISDVQVSKRISSPYERRGPKSKSPDLAPEREKGQDRAPNEPTAGNTSYKEHMATKYSTSIVEASALDLKVVESPSPPARPSPSPKAEARNSISSPNSNDDAKSTDSTEKAQQTQTSSSKKDGSDQKNDEDAESEKHIVEENTQNTMKSLLERTDLGRQAGDGIYQENRVFESAKHAQKFGDRSALVNFRSREFSGKLFFDRPRLRFDYDSVQQKISQLASRIETLAASPRKRDWPFAPKKQLALQVIKRQKLPQLGTVTSDDIINVESKAGVGNLPYKAPNWSNGVILEGSQEFKRWQYKTKEAKRQEHRRIISLGEENYSMGVDIESNPKSLLSITFTENNLDNLSVACSSETFISTPPIDFHDDSFHSKVKSRRWPSLGKETPSLSNVSLPNNIAGRRYSEVLITELPDEATGTAEKVVESFPEPSRERKLQRTKSSQRRYTRSLSTHKSTDTFSVESTSNRKRARSMALAGSRNSKDDMEGLDCFSKIVKTSNGVTSHNSKKSCSGGPVSSDKAEERSAITENTTKTMTSTITTYERVKVTKQKNAVSSSQTESSTKEAGFSDTSNLDLKVEHEESKLPPKKPIEGEWKLVTRSRSAPRRSYHPPANTPSSPSNMAFSVSSRTSPHASVKSANPSPQKTSAQSKLKADVQNVPASMPLKPEPARLDGETAQNSRLCPRGPVTSTSLSIPAKDELSSKSMEELSSPVPVYSPQNDQESPKTSSRKASETVTSKILDTTELSERIVTAQGVARSKETFLLPTNPVKTNRREPDQSSISFAGKTERETPVASDFEAPQHTVTNPEDKIRDIPFPTKPRELTLMPDTPQSVQTEAEKDSQEKEKKNSTSTETSQKSADVGNKGLAQRIKVQEASSITEVVERQVKTTTTTKTLIKNSEERTGMHGSKRIETKAASNSQKSSPLPSEQKIGSSIETGSASDTSYIKAKGAEQRGTKLCGASIQPPNPSDSIARVPQTLAKPSFTPIPVIYASNSRLDSYAPSKPSIDTSESNPLSNTNESKSGPKQDGKKPERREENIAPKPLTVSSSVEVKHISKTTNTMEKTIDRSAKTEVETDQHKSPEPKDTRKMDKSIKFPPISPNPQTKLTDSKNISKPSKDNGNDSESKEQSALHQTQNKLFEAQRTRHAATPTQQTFNFTSHKLISSSTTHIPESTTTGAAPNRFEASKIPAGINIKTPASNAPTNSSTSSSQARLSSAGTGDKQNPGPTRNETPEKPISRAASPFKPSFAVKPLQEPDPRSQLSSFNAAGTIVNKNLEKARLDDKFTDEERASTLTDNFHIRRSSSASTIHGLKQDDGIEEVEAMPGVVIKRRIEERYEVKTSSSRSTSRNTTTLQATQRSVSFDPNPVQNFLTSAYSTTSFPSRQPSRTTTTTQAPAHRKQLDAVEEREFYLRGPWRRYRTWECTVPFQVRSYAEGDICYLNGNPLSLNNIMTTGNTNSTVATAGGSSSTASSCGSSASSFSGATYAASTRSSVNGQGQRVTGITNRKGTRADAEASIQESRRRIEEAREARMKNKSERVRRFSTSEGVESL